MNTATAGTADFPYIWKKYDEALSSFQTLTEAELKQHEADSWASLAGVPYLDEQRKGHLISQDIQTRTEKADDIRKRRDIFWSKLVAAGAEPLVIVTKKTCNRFCEVLRLYVFHMQWDGRVLLSQEPLKRMTTRAEITMFIMNIIAILAAGCYFGNVLFYQDKYPLGESMFLGILLMIVFGAWFVVSAVKDTKLIKAMTAFWTDLQCRFLVLLSRDHLLSMFMPGRSTLQAEPEGVVVRPVFPPASTDVANTLKNLRKSGFSISIAAVSEAFDFVGGYLAIAKAARKKTREDVEGARRTLEQSATEAMKKLFSDPIILVESDDLVAFVRQYGNFAPEKALIDRLLSERDIF